MKYQDRYLEHQKRKKEQLTYSEETDTKPEPIEMVYEALNQRRSQRIFNNDQVTEEQYKKLLEAATMAPNSCNRHGVRLRPVGDRRGKELLGGLLVGGVGWVHRSQIIFLLLADPEAYGSPNEKDFMHYCDVGFKAMNMWLMAESLGLGACYINPNLVDKAVFTEKFGKLDDKELIFCGALAIGNYDIRPKKAQRPSLKDILI